MKNERGMALVMVLILALISLAIVSALLFMMTQGTQLSGYHKFYRTVDEAGLGGADIATTFIINRGTVPADLNALIGPLAGPSAAGCLAQKMGFSTANWSGVCVPADKTLDAKTYPDMRFDLGSYRVFTKIVDTIQGNSDTSNLVTEGNLGGAGTVNSNSAMISPPQIPYLYSIEIQAEASASPREKSLLSVLYAY